MTRYSWLIISVFFCRICTGQPFDTARYSVSVQSSPGLDGYFMRDHIWRGGDGASSIDLGKGKVLWLFSDSFIARDSKRSRDHATLIRNSIAIQENTVDKPEKSQEIEDTQEANGWSTDTVTYFWNQLKDTSEAFFVSRGEFWFWTGHGTLIRDKLCIFLMKVRAHGHGLGFEIFGWSVVLISNPFVSPFEWEMEYIEGPETYGTIAGSAAVLSDENYLYAYGAVEPETHEVYVLRWKLTNAYRGNFSKPEWWIDHDWRKRKAKDPIPEPLFIGGTEFSVHYDITLKKYLQIQSFGFGEGEIGLRMSDHAEGPWTEPYLFYHPEYPGVQRPFMYSAKAHPELPGDGIYITYNVNSFDLHELVENQSIYFPKFILLKMEEKLAR